jgi:hypothetical protein
MTDSTETKAQAWQPLTPCGVAAFARAPLRRLLLVQFIFALLAATAVVWFLRTAWFPTVREAIRQLPAKGEISSGRLNWFGDSPQLLAEGHFLAFVVDTNHTGSIRSPAQTQIEFGRDDFRVISLGGYYHEFYYANERALPFNRTDLQPWWGAWQPPILWITFGGALLWLFASWTALATIYFLPVWLGGFFANRDLTLHGSWKLAGAALMPGALLMIVTIVFYGIGALDLVQLAAGFAAHFVATWVYLIWAVWVSPKLSSGVIAKQNPFATKVTDAR